MIYFSQIFDILSKKCILAPDGFNEELLVPFVNEHDIVERQIEYDEYQYYPEDYYEDQDYQEIVPTVLEYKFPELCSNPQSTKNFIQADDLVVYLENNVTEIYNKDTSEQILEFCLDHGFLQSKSIGTVAVNCVNCALNTCINFCCPKGQYQDSTGICKEYQYDPENAIWWIPDVLDSAGSNGRSIYHSLDCEETFSVNNANDSIEILSDGSIRLAGSLEGSVYKWNSYCLSHVEELDENSELIYYEDFHICPGSSISGNELVEWQDLVNQKIIPALQLISVVSLAILFMFLFHTKKHCLFG